MLSFVFYYTSLGKSYCTLPKVHDHSIEYIQYCCLNVIKNSSIFFSLDVEGSELQILQTIPFDRVDIKIIDVEHKHLGRIFPGSFQELHELMEVNGYDFLVETKDPFGYPNDVIYVKKGYIEELDELSNSKLSQCEL